MVQQYELSFVPPKRWLRTRPQLVISIDLVHLEEVAKRLDTLHSQHHDYAKTYCGDEVSFQRLARDLFGRLEFGYGNCAHVRQEGSKAHIHIELDRERLHSRTLTLKHLFDALAVPMSGPSSNQTQQVDIQTACRYDAMGYGHAIGGYVSQRMLTWLRAQKGEANFMGHTPLPDAVISAMRWTWSSVAHKDQARWTSDCNGFVSADGRFVLNCFGNACDIAIYPDGSCGNTESDPYVRFSCHNLDTAAQQLTLIAGLAKMCEMARQDE